MRKKKNEERMEIDFEEKSLSNIRNEKDRHQKKTGINKLFWNKIFFITFISYVII